jgi:fatty acid desaturase
VRREYLLNYLAGAVVYGVIAYFTRVQRVGLGFLASATLHALFLWYYFAIKTHAGYSTAAMETRSHNYDGALLYWLSFGLSLHRVHHMTPRLAWLQTYGLWESRSVDGKA